MGEYLWQSSKQLTYEIMTASLTTVFGEFQVGFNRGTRNFNCWHIGCLDTPLEMVVASSNQALQFKVTHLWIIATPKKVESTVKYHQDFLRSVYYYSVKFAWVSVSTPWIEIFSATWFRFYKNRLDESSASQPLWRWIFRCLFLN